MKFGLKELTVAQIQTVFSRYPQVEKAILYGSRAVGNFKNGSDIDLTLEGKDLTLSILHKIDNDLDDLLLPYTFDLSIFAHIDDADLIEHIQRVGLVFYPPEKDKADATKTFRLGKTVYEALIAHAQSDAPNECCGLLAGEGEIVSEIYPIPNLPSDDPAVADLKVPADRRLRYVMDPKAQISAFKKMRETGTEMLAIYHSHTASEAYPSATDVRLAFYPEVHYLIVSLENPDAPVLRAFRIVDQEISEDEIEVNDFPSPS